MNKTLNIIIITLLLQGCAVWPAGEDPAGKKFRAEAQLLNNALVQYRNATGVLPRALKELVPTYLHELPDLADKVFYSLNKGGLNYSYSPSWPQSGKISCDTIIGSGKWYCHGYI